MLVHTEETIRASIANLKMAISDQNLELIPDYEQRIEVLKELKFIDANSTVSLKGRVACEVSLAPPMYSPGNALHLSAHLSLMNHANRGYRSIP